MTESLLRLWNPLANVAGAAAGAIAIHLWARFRRRMTTLRWTSQTQAFALSGSDVHHGVVEVLYNGTPAQNLYVVTVQVVNDTSNDLSELELQAGFRDGSTFLSAAGSIRGSLRVLSLSEGYLDVANRYLAAPEEERPADWQAQILSNRFFSVPVLNRGDVADLAFLVHAPTGVVPRLVVTTEHEGVRLRAVPPTPQLLGVRQDHAGWAGFLLGLVLVSLLGVQGIIPLWSSIGVFMLGSLGILTGIITIWAFRIIMKALS